MLKKRLLSSPAAFKHTLDQHMMTLATLPRRRQISERLIHEAAAALEDEADDTALVSEQEQEALALAGGALAGADEPTQER